MKKKLFLLLSSCTLLSLASTPAFAWDYEGHRIVNQLAIASLPSDFPSFALTPDARERIAFLAGEPDRWRNTHDMGNLLDHFNGPDHYIDLEELGDYGLSLTNLTHYRYDFVAQLALARYKFPDRFAPIDPDMNRDHTRQLIGFLPWAIAENYSKLKSGFSCLKTFQEDGTPEEIANAQQNIIYIMGVMGHYVGDSSQPLHTTIHHHGWKGPNPNHYTTNSSFHAWIDGGFFQKIGGVKAAELSGAIHTSQPLPGLDHFSQFVDYIGAQHKLVEPLYQLQKEGKLSGEGEAGREGKAFLTQQLVVGGQMLGEIWVTAWHEAGADSFLKSQLARRKLMHSTPAPAK